MKRCKIQNITKTDFSRSLQYFIIKNGFQIDAHLITRSANQIEAMEILANLRIFYTYSENDADDLTTLDFENRQN